MPRILLVEDNEMSRDMSSRRLSRRGHEIVTARNGLQAIQMANSEAPDLVLMDLSLPELDGWEATRRLKVDAATCAIPIVALTAHAMAGDHDRAIGAGCDEYETKPIELPRLIEKNNRLLKIPV